MGEGGEGGDCVEKSAGKASRHSQKCGCDDTRPPSRYVAEYSISLLFISPHYWPGGAGESLQLFM